jgi:hypothetical protein
MNLGGFGSCASCRAPISSTDVLCSGCLAHLPAGDISPVRVALCALALIVAEGAVFLALVYWQPPL